MRIIGENEEIDFGLDYDKKKFTKKMLIFGTIAIVVIVCSSIAGIHVAKAYNYQLISKNYEENSKNDEVISDSNNNNTLENASQEQNEITENVSKEEIKLPVYSEEAQKRVNDIYNSDDGEKIAYLTFDDGPSSKVTPQVLQILKDENIKASFFVLRKYGRSKP